MNKEKLDAILNKIEHDFGVCVVLISECSSRAWGLATESSDYDIRFSYYQLPWKQNVQDTSSTIRVQIGDADCQGYDIRKTVAMLTNSSLATFEMMESPIQYAADLKVRDQLTRVLYHYYNKYKLFDTLTGCARRLYMLSIKERMTVKSLQHILRMCMMADMLVADQFLMLSVDMLKLPADIDPDGKLLNRVLSLRQLPHEEVTAFFNSQEYAILDKYMAYSIEQYFGGRPERIQTDQQFEFANKRYQNLMRRLYFLDTVLQFEPAPLVGAIPDEV